MKAIVKIINPNTCGLNHVETFETIKEFKNWLNHAIYYCGEVYLNIPCFNESYKYSETNNVMSILSECNHYDETLEVIQTFEEINH